MRIETNNQPPMEQAWDGRWQLLIKVIEDWNIDKDISNIPVELSQVTITN